MANAAKIYEINTAVYLARLSQELQTRIALDNIHDSEIDKLVELGFNTVWLMGVWERSPKAIDVNKSDSSFMSAIASVLPDFTDEDLIGSAYSIKDYKINASFGGESALKSFRQRLNDHGLKLILDFVPNHVGPDNHWTSSNKDIFILADNNEANEYPSRYFKKDDGIYAKGRDPTSPPWSDVLQLNAFSSTCRQLALVAIREIAALCDGVRCDMAMLLLNRIFANSWGDGAGELPKTEYWQDIIGAIKADYPEFIFIAEAYWDTQSELINLGFNYCYDKSLLDYLAQGNNVALLAHISSTFGQRSKLLSFIENHDEQRSAAIFSNAKTLAAAACILTLPGGSLVYDGQLEGYSVRIPVHLGRAPSEPINELLRQSYYSMLGIIKRWNTSELNWEMLETNNNNALAWLWYGESSLHIVVINYSANPMKVAISVNRFNPENHGLIDEISQTALQTDKSMNGNSAELDLRPWQVMLIT